MATSQSTTHHLSSSQPKHRKLYERHKIKLLNSALAVYVCFGALLFDSLGEFYHQTSGRASNRSKSVNEQEVSLRELRLNSVRRMWNITNQLNILYESNWTALVLEELIEFERKFLKSLTSQESDGDQVEMGDERKSKNKSASDESNGSNRSKSGSVKKSFIHSLATITTIGSPVGPPKSQVGKLATVLYGAIGIPLLFVTVAQTGAKLAHSTLNTLLTIRHYCFALPVHYLCCACSPYLCFRWLSWCCCCCCCSYLCCLSNKNKTKCCDTRNAPKLRLRSRKPEGGATSSVSQQPHQSAYVIGGSFNLAGDKLLPGNSIQQKSVRFVGQNKQFATHNYDEQAEFVGQKGDSNKENQNGYKFYSLGLLTTSLVALSLYLTIGAYFYSRSQNTSLVEALYVCFSMLSTSKLPDSFNLDRRPKISVDPNNLYSALKSNDSQTKPKVSGSNSDTTIEDFIWSSLFLLCGLHLVSMCGHFARLWLSGESADLVEEDELKPRLCNGYVGPSMMGSLSSQQTFSTDHLQPPVSDHQIEVSTKGEHYVMQTTAVTAISAPQQLPGLSSAASIQLQQQQPQQARQVDLAELFVVSQESSPAELHHHHHHQQQQQPHYGRTSDMSFASDRSADRASLCQHHQAQLPSSIAQSSPATMTTSQAALYGPSFNDNQLIHHNHHHVSQQHLYLPTTTTTGQQVSLEDEGEDEEETEMGKMLNGCLAGKLRSSSSSTQLSRSINGEQPSSCMTTLTSNGFGSQMHSNTLTRITSGAIRLRQLDNGAEFDSSLNNTTNSNTISSISSSRTVKFPQQQMRLPNGIGFILDESKQQ